MVANGSLFSQLLRHFPRSEFVALAKKHAVERYAKGFKSWTHFVAMLFCQLARAVSLREICNGLACCLGKLVHLGIGKAPNKSTLAYANEHRSADFFRDLFWAALGRFRAQGSLGQRKSKFRFRNKLLSLDSTTISLCLKLFPWAKFRRTKGGIKLHVLLDHDDYLPVFVSFSMAKKHDVKAARLLNLVPASIVVMDRGYMDLVLFNRWTGQGVFFVTRLKGNAAYQVVEERKVPENRDVLSDQIIRFTGYSSFKKCPHLLRLVTIWDAEKKRQLVFLTNQLQFGPTTIAAIYKDRWEIELFFKALKQNLRLKTFVGTTENALLVQIWTALIAMLLLKWMHHLSKSGWSLSNLAAMLRMNLFTYRDLEEWLNNPLGTPPLQPAPVQLALALPHVGQQTRA